MYICVYVHMCTCTYTYIYTHTCIPKLKKYSVFWITADFVQHKNSVKNRISF